MTTKQTLRALSSAGKPISVMQLYRYFKQFGIRPVSEISQRPQQYPETTAEVILANLGLGGATQAEEPSRRVTTHARRPARLLSVQQLKRVARRTTKGTK